MDPTKIHSLRIHCFQSQHNAGYLEGRDEYNTLFLFITHLSKQMITELHENARGLRSQEQDWGGISWKAS